MKAITVALPEQLSVSELPVNEKNEDTVATDNEATSQLILVAEDNVTNQTIIKRQLSILGYDCAIANDGKEALAMLSGTSYALLLTDINMPEMDGLELTSSIRDKEQGSSERLPIVAITGTLDDAEIDRCMKAGMDDCMAKPLNMEKLKQILLDSIRV